MKNVQGINFTRYICPQQKGKVPVSFSGGEERGITADDIKNYSSAKSSEILSKLKIEDKKLLEKITEYNSEIRRKPQKISLDRNPLFECNIPYQKDSYYRMIAKSGYEDFLITGKIRPKQNTKEDYSEIYFEKGRANNIYAKRGGSEYIVESRAERIVEGKAHYPRADMLEKDKDPFRIWHRAENGGYEIVYDTMSDVISRNPDFRYEG